MTRSLALAYAAEGIRADCVCPGSIWTDMWAEVDHEIGAVEIGLQPGEYRQQRASRIPLGRLGEPEDVARVVFLHGIDPADPLRRVVELFDGGKNARRLCPALRPESRHRRSAPLHDPRQSVVRQPP